MGAIEEGLCALSPRNELQRSLQTRAVQIAGDIADARWLGVERAQSKMPTPFLIVLVCWLSAMFMGFGLFSPNNAVALAALFVGALAVSTSILLIEELNGPLDGGITVSSAPLRGALKSLGK